MEHTSHFSDYINASSKQTAYPSPREAIHLFLFSVASTALPHYLNNIPEKDKKERKNPTDKKEKKAKDTNITHFKPYGNVQVDG